ncbi:MAG: CvpA family protein [Dongiaceae bacterium]
MNEGDIFVLSVVAISAVLAFYRGFVREILSVGSWVAAAAATYFGLPTFQHILREQIVNFPIVGDFVKDSSVKDLAADILTGLIIFIVALIVASVVSHFLSRNIRTSMFGSVDRSLGALFGVVRGALLVCLIFLGVDWWFPVDKRPAFVTEARTLPVVSAGAEYLRPLVDWLGQKTVSSESTRATVDQAIELGTVTGVVPQPGETTSATGDSAGTTGNSGYKDAERNDLERLIQGTQ